MATKTLSDLPVASTPANADITHIRQSSVDKSLTLNLLAEFVQRSSDFSTLIETRSADKDYLAAELERDARIFANCTAATITLGLFNGSSRNGEIAIITCIGTANQVNVELVSAGVTDVILNAKDTLTMIWNAGIAAWQILNIDRGAIYDFIVRTQEDLNFIVERVAANQYKFKDGFTSIYFKYLSGGYLCYGGTSFLSGGDLYGYIKTNNCANLIFEEGAYLHMGNERGYLEINTTGCYLLNVDIRGLGAVASTITQSFYINSTTNVVLKNCKTSNRLSDGQFFAFYSGVDMSKGKIINCIVENIESTNIGVLCIGFQSCKNLTNCQAIDIRSTGNGAVGYQQCDNLVNCRSYDIDATGIHAYGFQTCDNLVNCKADKIDHSGAVAGQSAYGFSVCTYLSNCSASDIDTNGAGGNADGFNTCTNIGESYATTCNNGFHVCNEITGCFSTLNSIDGYNTCNRISSSRATSNTGQGFNVCYCVVACDSESNGGAGFLASRRINASYSANNTGWGFNNTIQLNTNQSTGNTAGQYTASFADFAGANAAADTAAGGYNA